jgi:galactose mutarotase-like enzyme
MKLYGKNWRKREIESQVGKMDQIGGITRLKYTEGRESETELIQVRTGAGLTYCISPTRGFDLVSAEFAGTPLSWHSPNGPVHPGLFQPQEMEWLKTAAGGLLMTCGLTQVGSPCIDGDEVLGLHGNIHHIPAKNICTSAEWVENEYVLIASGVMEETRIFGHHLQLKREIKSFLGQNRILIRDIVENKGFKSAPHMILYHFNFGFPLMNEHTVLDFPSKKVVSRDSHVSLNDYQSWEIPSKNRTEKVYYHENLQVDECNNTVVKIKNPAFPIINDNKPITLNLSWDARTLSKFVQWKMNAEGINVLGIEPSNCYVEGRVKERERGSLRYLEPGEKVEYQIELSLELNGDKENFLLGERS